MLELKPLTYAVYGRISLDKDNDAKGVKRQIELGHQLANSRGFQLAKIPGSPGWGAGEFVDNDISASKGKRRESYERLINHTVAGDLDVIILYMSSRLWRNRKERAIAFEKLGESKVKIVSVRGQEIDLSTAAGRMIAGILGEVDAHETEQMGERRKDALAQQAREGYYQGPTPFGFKKVYEYKQSPNGTMTHKYTGRIEVIPELRDELRAAADHIIMGGSIRGIVMDWNFRGIRTARGNRWTAFRLRQVLLAPYAVGLRGGGDGRAGQGAVYQRWTPRDEGNHVGGWEPMLDLETRDVLYEILTSPERNPGGPALGRGNAKYLLSGIAKCGHCGRKVIGKKFSDRMKRPKRPTYTCSPPPNGCGKSCRSIAAVDAWVVAHIAHWLVPNGAYDAAIASAALAATPQMAVILAEQARDRAARDRLDDRLTDGEFDDEDGRTDMDAYRRQCRRLDQRMAERKRQIDRLGLDVALDAIPERGAGFMKAWKAAGIMRQREIVRAMVAEIVFEPVDRRGNRVDLSKIRVTPGALLIDAPPQLLELPAA